MQDNKDENRVSWWFWPFWFISILLSPILFLLLSIACVLWLPFAYVFDRYYHSRFIKQMKEQGRYLPWNELEPRLVAGEGTVFFEGIAATRYARIWWIPDVVKQPCPNQQHTEIDEFYLKRILNKKTPQCFVTWDMVKPYLHLDTGQAFLSELKKGADIPYTEVEFNQKFPNLNIITTAKDVRSYYE